MPIPLHATIAFRPILTITQGKQTGGKGDIVRQKDTG